MEGYTVKISDELRIAIDAQAAKEPRVTSADVARRWLEMGRRVQESGCNSLDEFCRAVATEALDGWTKEA